MRWLNAIGVLLLVGLAAAPVRAAALPDGGVTAAEVAATMQRKGYKAEITKDKWGDPLLKSASSGVDFDVYFYECHDKPRCGSIQFYAGFDKPGLTDARVGEWNRTKRFGRVYLDTNGNPAVEMDMDVQHGATTEAIVNDLDRWLLVLAEFMKFIDWKS